MSLPLPDDAQVTLTVGELRAMLEGRDLETFEGVGTTEAAALTGETSRALRRLWGQWDRAQQDGRRPPVRVSRKGSSDRSDLLFDRNDCIAYGSKPSPPGPRAVADPEPDHSDPNDVDAIAARLQRGQ